MAVLKVVVGQASYGASVWRQAGRATGCNNPLQSSSWGQDSQVGFPTLLRQRPPVLNDVETHVLSLLPKNERATVKTVYIDYPRESSRHFAMIHFRHPSGSFTIW